MTGGKVVRLQRKKRDQEATGGWCSFIRPHRLSGAEWPHAPGLFSELVAGKDFSVARSCRLQHPTVSQAACLCVSSPTVGATLRSVKSRAWALAFRIRFRQQETAAETMSRPPFWRVPRNTRDDDLDEGVYFGSPASEVSVKRGDAVVKINGLAANDLTHQQAVDLMKNAGSTLSILINRAGNGAAIRQPPPQPAAAPVQAKPFVPLLPPSRTIGEIMASPVMNLPTTYFPPSEQEQHQLEMIAEERADREREKVAFSTQPYRTLPLVLPGAKIKRDVPVSSQSYLAMQHNSMMWHPPSTTPPNPVANPVAKPVATETVLKEKEASLKLFDPARGWRNSNQLEAAAAVLQQNATNTAAAEGPELPAEAPTKQEVVIKQFNSPLGLYSNENIQEALALQTGAVAPPAAGGAPRMLDLKSSDTYRALMEEEYMPSKSKEFKPPAAKVAPPPKAPGLMGKSEKIAQSGTFNRLMMDVLGECDF